MKKSGISAPSYNPRTIHPADQAKGDVAEGWFQDWLDKSQVAYIYLDQTPFSVPAHLRGQFKRPDYWVAVPTVGGIAFDVKAKSLYNGCFIFELDEIRRLRTFARMYSITVFFACLDAQGSQESYWVRLDQFDSMMPVQRNGSMTFAIPANEAQHVSMRQPFQDALSEALRLA